MRSFILGPHKLPQKSLKYQENAGNASSSKRFKNISSNYNTNVTDLNYVFY